MIMVLAMMIASCFKVAFKLALCKKGGGCIGRACNARNFF